MALDVLAPFQHVFRERLAEAVAAGRLHYSGLEHSLLHCLLHHARIEIVAALGTGLPVAPAVLLGEDPLPRPFRLRDRILLEAIEMGGIDSSSHGWPRRIVAIAPSHPSPVALLPRISPSRPRRSNRWRALGPEELQAQAVEQRIRGGGTGALPWKPHPTLVSQQDRLQLGADFWTLLDGTGGQLRGLYFPQDSRSQKLPPCSG